MYTVKLITLTTNKHTGTNQCHQPTNITCNNFLDVKNKIINRFFTQCLTFIIKIRLFISAIYQMVQEDNSKWFDCTAVLIFKIDLLHAKIVFSQPNLTSFIYLLFWFGVALLELHTFIQVNCWFKLNHYYEILTVFLFRVTLCFCKIVKMLLCLNRQSIFLSMNCIKYILPDDALYSWEQNRLNTSTFRKYTSN